MIFGLVLAGGRSSRFGQEKATAVLAGQPMIAHIAGVLNAGCERVAVNAKPGTGAAAFAEAQGHLVLQDAVGDPDGPLSGVKAGLQWAHDGGAEWLATAPCDTPFLPPDLIARLALVAEPGRPVVARTVEGLQPLCTLWPVKRIADIAAMLSCNNHPALKSALAVLNAAELEFEPSWRFDNLNTPDDFAAAVSRAMSI